MQINYYKWLKGEMGYFKISPPWDSNKGYVSECVISRCFGGAVGEAAYVDCSTELWFLNIC